MNGRKASDNLPYVSAGERYGRWLVLETARTGGVYVLCRCECGTERAVIPYQLRPALERRGTLSSDRDG